MSVPPFVPAAFVPSLQNIFAASNSNPLIIETLNDHGYSDGLIVSFVVPKERGMVQLNKQMAPITVLSADTFSVPIDSRGYDPFIALDAPLESNLQFAQVLPSAEEALTLDSAIHNNNNISPEF